MFEFIRKHTKVMQVILFLLILPSFVLFGIDGYTRNQEKGDVVATVDGRDVLKSEWDNFHQREATRIRETMKQIDPKLLDTPEARYASLDRLVREKVFAAAADKQKITASDAKLARDLGENEAIASLRRPDGSIDMQRYAELVSRQGMSPDMFEAQVRRDLALRQVLGGITAASFAPQSVVDRGLGAFFERREVQLLRFPASDFASKVVLTDADTQAYYDGNTTQFQAPESAQIEYLVLDLKSIERSISLKLEDVQKYYEQNKARLASSEERRARHVLVAAAKDAPAAAKSAARAKAAEVLALAKAKPDSFADLAKKFSDDPGSKEQGGDLDFFARGAMVKQFDEVVFAMKAGEISNVVETDFGFHVIQLTEVRGANERSFEEMRAGIEADMRKEQARTKFAEFAEPFTNSVFENPDNLRSTAERFGLKTQTMADLRRTPPPGASGPVTNPRFLEAIFSADSISKKANTAAIDVGGSQLVSGRIVTHSPARVLPLAEVKPRVAMLATQAKAQALAKAEGEKALAILKAGQVPAGMGPAVVVSRDTQGEARQPQKLVEAVMRVDSAKLPGDVGVDVPGVGYVVARVTKTLPREERKPELLQQERKQFGEFVGNAESAAYLNMLKGTFKVDIKVAKPAKTADPV